jgi:four helix bundle protein
MADIDAEYLRNRSQRFALDVIAFCDTLPADERTQEIAAQLHDVANSEAMNYRAACRARSPAEFIAKICVTVEEADEAQGWLQVLIKSGKARGERVERLLREATELLMIFAKSKSTAMRNAKAKKLKPQPKPRRTSKRPDAR